MVSLYLLYETAYQKDQVVILGLHEREQNLPVLNLDKLEVIRAITAQICNYLVDVRDPTIVNLAEFLLNFLLKLWVVEDAERHSVLLAQECMVLVEAIEVGLVEGIA